MRLLQKYILGELLKVFCFAISVLTLLLVFVGAFSQISENGLGPVEVLKILPFLVPSMLPFTIPATMLLTVTVVYGRVAADNEITAAKAAGISALSMFWPAFIMGAVLSLASLFLTDQVIPWAVSNIEQRVAQMMEKIFLDMLGSRKLFVHKDKGISIAVDDVVGRKLIRPVIKLAHGGEAITVQAKEASIRFDLEKRLVRLRLLQGNIEVPNHQYVKVDQPEYSFPLPQDQKKKNPREQSLRDLKLRLTGVTSSLDQARNQRDVEAAFALAIGDFERLDDGELLRYEVDLGNNKDELAKLRMNVHMRFALSASCLFFTLLGGPFAVLQARRQFITSFFLCFLPILIGYYPIALLMMNLSKTGTVNPAWAMWTGNAILLAVSVNVLRRVLKH